MQKGEHKREKKASEKLIHRRSEGEGKIRCCKYTNMVFGPKYTLKEVQDELTAACLLCASGVRPGGPKATANRSGDGRPSTAQVLALSWWAPCRGGSRLSCSCR
jgi:hypothetical protein